MHKPYALVSGITKKSLQTIDGRRREGVKICIFVPVCYNSLNASHIHELKMNRLLCDIHDVSKSLSVDIQVIQMQTETQQNLQKEMQKMQQKFKTREEKAKKDHRDEMARVWIIFLNLQW